MAARYVDAVSGFALFGIRIVDTSISGCDLFYSSSGQYGKNFALRPVVTISASLITGEKDANEAWNLSK